MIKIFEEIADSLDAIYEKSKDREIKGVRNALLHHDMILFSLFFADILQISNNFCKFLQSRVFSSLRSKVERDGGTPQEIHGKYRNREILFS